MTRRGTNRLTTYVWAGILLVGVVSIALFATNVLRVARSVDARAYEQDAGALAQGLRLIAELTAAETVSLSFWAEAYENTTARPSLPWMRRNLGRAVFSDPDEQRLAIIDPSGAVAFESSVSGAPQPREAGAILASARTLLQRLDRAYRAVHDSDGDVDQRHGDGLVEGIYAHAFATLNDRPVLLVASPMLPDAGAELPEAPAVLLDIRYLTPAFLARVSEMSHLSNVRPGSRSDPAWQTLVGEDGRLVDVLAWDHFAPAGAVMRSMQPAFIASIGLVALLSLSMAQVLRSRARALAESERSALFAARHDGATGLANRKWFMEELARIGGSRGGPGLVLIDCDYFKAVNDTLGHAAGDAVLLAIAARLEASSGGAIQIAGRLGGDEFAAVTRPVARVEDLATILDRLSGDLMQPVDFEGRRIPVSVSIGAAFLSPAADAGMSLQHADAALYRAKRDGRGCWRLFDRDLDDAGARPVDEAALRRDPRDALRQAA